MSDDFVVESSSEFGINVRHTVERHLYLFAISDNQAGGRILATPSVRAYKKAKHAPEEFQQLACAFALREAQSLGLLMAQPVIDPIEPANQATSKTSKLR